MDFRSELRARLGSSRAKTIHLISGCPDASEMIQDISEQLGLKLFRLVGSGIEFTDTLLEAVSQAMCFPPYFGKNWDALEECLRDLEWITAQGYLILFEEPLHLWEVSPHALVMFLEIVISVAEEWAQEQVPFHLVLVDENAGIDTEAFASMRQYIQVYG